MERSTPEHVSSAHKRLSVSFLVSLMVLGARYASRVSKKIKLKPTKKRNHLEDYLENPKSNSAGEGGGGRGRFGWSPARTFSPMRARPKELLTTLSNKAMTMVGRKNKAYDGSGGTPTAAEMVVEEDEEEYGVWQREILMGGKCEPLDYSGVIYYDCSGHQLKRSASEVATCKFSAGSPDPLLCWVIVKPDGKRNLNFD